MQSFIMSRVLQKAPPTIIQSLFKMMNSEGATLEYNLQKVNIFAHLCWAESDKKLNKMLHFKALF